MSSLPPWKNVYKSGMWPDPNNNLLRACLPRHNAAESKVRLSNTAAFVLNLFLFSLNHFSAPTTTQSCRFFFPSLTLLSCLYHWHDIVMLFHSLSESKARKEFLSCQRSSVSLGKKWDIHLLEKCDTYSDTSTPAWKWKWRSVFGSLLTKKKRPHSRRCNHFFF